MTETYRRIVLAARPDGAVAREDFRLETQPIPTPQPGEVLVRNHYLSLDPYMRGRMNDSRSYATPQALGETMVGATVGDVLTSDNPRFAKGDTVVGMYGWSEYGCSDGAGLMKVDVTHVSESAHLGPAGMPGMTAWYGLNKVIEPKAGETIVVSAASGAVGSVVGQLARLAGCRAVGVAGGPDKCAYVVAELGFDACIDYKAAPDRKALYAALKEATPDGVDGYFENVGGVVMNTVLSRLNPFARVAMCGLISGYDDADGPEPIENPAMFLVARFKMQGFIVSDHLALWPQGLKELATHVATGRLKYRETIADGIESAPEAFIGLLKGRNFGKQLVKLF
ncbi:MAG: NADP-dependent oxidoreductase [Burkholderiaceae bacterium]